VQRDYHNGEISLFCALSGNDSSATGIFNFLCGTLLGHNSRLLLIFSPKISFNISLVFMAASLSMKQN